MKRGAAGIGVYWCIVEMLYENKGKINTSEYERISFELRVDEELVKDVVENYELFSFNEHKFWSESAISRLKERALKTSKAKDSASKRWTSGVSNANALPTQCDGNAIKENKIKEDINIVYKYNSFYDSQVSKIKPENDGKYLEFVEYIFGRNKIEQKLNGILSIEEQLTEDQFYKLLEKCNANKTKIGTILTKIENDKKYYKGKKSLYLTMLNWAEDRFVKNN